MMRQSEYKKKLDPELGRYTRQHIWSGERSIYGGGITDVLNRLDQNYLERQLKKPLKKALKKQ